MNIIFKACCIIVTISPKIIEPESIGGKSESIHSGNVLAQSIHPGYNPVCGGSSFNRQCNQLRERQLESGEPSSL